MAKLSRRKFIVAAGTAAGGALLIGTPLLLRHHRASRRGAPPVGDHAWVRITPDNIITVVSTISEMGQGAMSGLLQALADELDAEWTNIRFELGHVDDAFYGRFGYYTAGSNSTRKRFPVYRDLGAKARAMLIAAAASLWAVPREECSTNAGSVHHPSSGRTESYGALASLASRQSIPEVVPLKSREQWRFIGKSLPRIDTPAKVDGSARYTIDVELPGQLHCAVRHCPVPGGRLNRVDQEPALSLPGVRQVVVLDDAVAVLADGYWQATRGLEALRPEWDVESSLRQDSSDLTSQMDTALLQLPEGESRPLPGEPPFSATYAAPMLAHAPLEPTSALARVEAGVAEIWAPSQEPHGCRTAVAEALGLRPDAVTVHRPLIGGGFGLRLGHAHAVEAARIAKSASAPVKVIWSREEDFLLTSVRPAARMRLNATFNADGSPSRLRIDSMTLGYERQRASFEPLPYRCEEVIYSHGQVPGNVRVGAWRSVDASFDIFFLESFLDECALKVRKDPVEYRLSLLDPGSRLGRTLTSLQQMCDYIPGRDGTRPIGFACFSGLESHVSLAVELDQPKGSAQASVARVWCAVDCGLVVNPALALAQIEGGILFALSAAVGERLTIRNGQVQQRNFAEYPLLRIAQAPEITVKLLDVPDHDPGGVGELAGPVVAPALANALLRLRGERQRSLPLDLGV